MCVCGSRSVVWTLCDLTDYTAHGILQAGILEWVAFPSPGDLPTQGLNPGLLLGIESRKQRAWAFPQRAHCLGAE